MPDGPGAARGRGEGYRVPPAASGAAPRRRDADPSRLAVWDLFCGVGGLSLGFEATGAFETVLGTDLMPDRLSTFAENHPAAAALGADIRRVAAADLEALAPRPHVIVGGPPCQGFSSLRPFRAVERGDPRNSLGEEFCRVAAAFRPEWLVVENVVGMIRAEGGRRLRGLLEALEAMGYRADARVLNAARHGLPQRRERLIVVGSLRGRAVRWPEPARACPWRSMAGASPLAELPGRPGLPPAVTFDEACGDLPELAAGEEASAYAGEPRTDWQREMRRGTPGLTMHAATAHSPAMVDLIREAGRNKGCLPGATALRGFSSSYSRLAGDEPATTVTVNFGHPSGSRCVHPRQDRALTAREAARLQGFPDAHAFHGGRSQVARQIGNAVPPPLGRAVAEAILASG